MEVIEWDRAQWLDALPDQEVTELLRGAFVDAGPVGTIPAIAVLRAGDGRAYIARLAAVRHATMRASAQIAAATLFAVVLPMRGPRGVVLPGVTHVAFQIVETQTSAVETFAAPVNKAGDVGAWQAVHSSGLTPQWRTGVLPAPAAQGDA